jgi:hypothetical protein
MSTTSATGYRDAVSQLEALADDLGKRGFATTLVTGHGYPSVTVVNKDASHLSDTIYAATVREDLSWWFWWSWADRIGPVADVETAAETVVRVLAAR